MMREYFDWWAARMLELVPERLRAVTAEDVEALVIEPEGDGYALPSAFQLHQLRARQLNRLGRFGLDASGLQAARKAASVTGRVGAVWLRVPERLLLEKTLTLPLAAERDVERVLGYGIDRETPFSADEVWWRYDILQRDRGKGKMQVRLSVVPRDPVADLVEALGHGGLNPTVLEIALHGGMTRQIPFNSASHGVRPALSRQVKVAAMVCAALAIIALGLPFLRQSIALGSLDSRMAELKPSVDQAETLRRQLDGTGGGGAVDAERARVGDSLAVLVAATSLLPDDTYLTDFSMQQRKLTLNGQSAAAAKLIGALAGNPTFKNPAFAAPVTRIEGAATEGFSISAEARP